jgi:hypothetical protein
VIEDFMCQSQQVALSNSQPLSGGQFSLQKIDQPCKIIRGSHTGVLFLHRPLRVHEKQVHDVKLEIPLPPQVVTNILIRIRIGMGLNKNHSTAAGSL